MVLLLSKYRISIAVKHKYNWLSVELLNMCIASNLLRTWPLNPWADTWGHPCCKMFRCRVRIGGRGVRLMEKKRGCLVHTGYSVTNELMTTISLPRLWWWNLTLSGYIHLNALWNPCFETRSVGTPPGKCLVSVGKSTGKNQQIIHPTTGLRRAGFGLSTSRSTDLSRPEPLVTSTFLKIRSFSGFKWGVHIIYHIIIYGIYITVSYYHNLSYYHI